MRWLKVLAFLLFPLSLFGGLNEQNDFQTWTEYALRFNMRRSALTLSAEQRYGNNSSELYLYYFQGLYAYELTKNIEIAPGYRQTYLQPFKHVKWRTHYSPFFDVTFRTRNRTAHILNRSRIQYTFVKEFPNFWEYRNRTTVILSHPFANTRYHPIFVEEFFFREREGYFENRIEFGGIAYWGNGSHYSMRYLWRIMRNEPHWINTHILRISLHFAF